MTTIGDIRTGIAATLKDFDLKTFRYPPDSPNPPCAYVDLLSVPEYHSTFNGAVHYQFIVRLLVSGLDAESGQAALDLLIDAEGDGSAVDAIEADQTLGGIVDSVMVESLRNKGIVVSPDADRRFFGAELLLDIYA